MTRRWLRWVLPAVVMLVGVSYLLATVTNDLFAVGPAFEEMIDDFRPLLQDDALAQAQADLDGLDRVAVEYDGQVVAAMAGNLGLTTAELADYVEASFPDVANGMAALPAIGDEFTGLVGLLSDQQSLFFSADEIPTADLPATTVPWAILAAGLAVLAVGGLMLQARRLGSWLAVGLGTLLVAVPLALSLPGKSGDADALNDNLEPVYTVATVQGAEAALGTVSAMGASMEAEMLPALADQLGVSGEELRLSLREFPALTAALDTMPDTLGRFGGFVDTFDANLDNYDTLQPVAFTPIIWTIVAGGVVVLLAGVVLLASDRQARAAGESEEVSPREPVRV